MKQAVGLYTAYNLWANKRIATKLKQISPDLLDLELKSSFSSLRKTVNHIWDAEVIWLGRLLGHSLEGFPSTKFDDVPAIDAFIIASQALLEYVKQVNDVDLGEVCKYQNTKGKEFITIKFQILMHVHNHSTFHRGQLVTMLRELGENDIPQTDLIAYLR